MKFVKKYLTSFSEYLTSLTGEHLSVEVLKKALKNKNPHEINQSFLILLNKIQTNNLDEKSTQIKALEMLSNMVEFYDYFFQGLSTDELLQFFQLEETSVIFSTVSHPQITARLSIQINAIVKTIEDKLSTQYPAETLLIVNTLFEPRFDIRFFINNCYAQYTFYQKQKLLSTPSEKEKFNLILEYYRRILMEHKVITYVDILTDASKNLIEDRYKDFALEFEKYGDIAVGYKFVRKEPKKYIIKFSFTTKIENKEFAYTILETIGKRDDFYQFLISIFGNKSKQNKLENLKALLSRDFVLKYLEPDYIDAQNIYKQISEGVFENQKYNNDFARIIEFIYNENKLFLK